jgi:uncharacterized OB-fold protein
MTTHSQINPSPAIDGWYTMDNEKPALLGSKCQACGTYAFPKQTNFCRNPDCDSDDFAEVPLSRTGVIWSYTNACYQPPEPFVAADPYLPFAIAAVTLEREQMTILGQVVTGVDVEQLQVGMEMELALETLYITDDADKVIWKWKPLAADGQASEEKT